MDPNNTSAHQNPEGHRGGEKTAKPPARSPLKAVAIIIIILLVAVGAIPRMQRSRRLDASAKEAIGAAPLVNTVKAVVSPPTSQLILPGNVQAVAETTINARATGYVRNYYVDIGAHVHAGQVLADIESPEIDQQLLQAQAEVEKSRASLGQSQADVAKQVAGVSQAAANTIAGSATVQQARANVQSKQANALQTQAAISSAQSGLARARESLSQRQSDQARARVAAELAGKTLGRWIALGKVNAVSGQEVDEKQAAYDSARDNLAAAQAAVDSARDDVEAARTQVASARADLGAALANVAAARQQVDAEQAALESEQAGVTAAKANVSASEQNVGVSQATIRASQASAQEYAALQSFQHIVAPFDGVITARNIDIGTLVTGGAPPGRGLDTNRTVPQTGLFGIARTDVLRIQTNVPQSFVANLHDGNVAAVTVPDLPGRTFTGQVFLMSGALDASSRTMQVEVRLPNPTGILIPGMYAKVNFTEKRNAPALIVPANTLIVDASGTRVAIVTAEGKVHFQTVQIQSDRGSTVEVGSGLTGNEKLITDPGDDLQEGETVQLAGDRSK